MVLNGDWLLLRGGTLENNYFLVKQTKPDCSNLQTNLRLFGLFSLLLLLQFLSEVTMTGCLTVL
jgi:hypothetical protein